MSQADADGTESEKTGLYCFITSDRACGAECMAYAAPPPGQDYKDQQWANCKILTSLHQASKHVALIARVVDSESADKKRLSQVPPKEPR